MVLYLATKNAGKLAEFRSIFKEAGWDVVTYGGYSAPSETAGSYAGNAALKARTLSAQLAASGVQAGTLGDDSGLEVGALGGRPGIRSARYGPAGASWGQRRAALLGELADVPYDRSARFICALHFIDEAGREFSVTGTCEGTIVQAERGHGGFSYDAVFAGGDGRTFAELNASEKNRVSHRRRAVERLLATLAAQR